MNITQQGNRKRFPTTRPVSDFVFFNFLIITHMTPVRQHTRPATAEVDGLRRLPSLVPTCSPTSRCRGACDNPSTSTTMTQLRETRMTPAPHATTSTPPLRLRGALLAILTMPPTPPTPMRAACDLNPCLNHDDDATTTTAYDPDPATTRALRQCKMEPVRCHGR